MVPWGMEEKTGGMFSGLEYILAPILLGIYLLVLGVIKLIVFIVKKLGDIRKELH